MLKRILKSIGKILLYTVLSTIGIVVLFFLYILIFVRIDPPEVKDRSALNLKRVQLEKEFYRVGNNYLRKNEFGNWEMYVEGKPFERGVAIGMLERELLEYQEDVFIAEIKKIIPSDAYLRFLKYLVTWFNRDIDEYVPAEYQAEIYGESLFAPDKYDFVGPKYQRMLNYHAAHDIGHALQSQNFFVGCTSFAASNSKTDDNTLLVGRNFDFFVGDDFAKNKVILLCHPDSGLDFISVTWPGMIGAVSGMNDAGIAVTINAGTAEAPTMSATPISIVVREILQYAHNISEAVKIAASRKTFVSESILVASAADNKAVIIEKSPTRQDVYETKENTLICSNHFQSESFSHDAENKKNKELSTSEARYRRMKDLLMQSLRMTPENAAAILRDRKGPYEKNIGNGNEQAINQLVAHHAVIFKPARKLLWVSTSPWQLGAFTCYNLDSAFIRASDPANGNELFERPLDIPADSFLLTTGYRDFLAFRSLKKYIQQAAARPELTASPQQLQALLHSNPDYYYSYVLAGDYFLRRGDKPEAKKYYTIALLKDPSCINEKNRIEASLKKCEE